MNIEEGARRIWPILVGIARTKGRDITYTELADKIGSKTPILGRQLGLILQYCIDERLPPLTVLVVGKNSRRPSYGFNSIYPYDVAEARQVVIDHTWNEPDPFDCFETGSTVGALARSLIKYPESAPEVYALVKMRGIRQLVFREAVHQAYNCCAFCGLQHLTCLQAGHIVPYTLADEELRISPLNGLLLCANHHLLFDRHEIVLDPDCIIRCAQETKGHHNEGCSDIIPPAGQSAYFGRTHTFRPSRDALSRRYQLFRQHQDRSDL